MVGVAVTRAPLKLGVTRSTDTDTAQLDLADTKSSIESLLA